MLNCLDERGDKGFMVPELFGPTQASSRDEQFLRRYDGHVLPFETKHEIHVGRHLWHPPVLRVAGGRDWSDSCDGEPADSHESEKENLPMHSFWITSSSTPLSKPSLGRPKEPLIWGDL